MLSDTAFVSLARHVQLYRGATFVLTPVEWIASWYNGFKAGLTQRMGEKMGRATRPRPPGPVLWIYAMGLGELMMARPVVERILANWPAVSLVVTPKHLYNKAVFETLYPSGTIFQCAPLDTPVAVRRFYRHWQPDFALWIRRCPTPNFGIESGRAGVPSALLQANLSERMAARWRHNLPLFRTALAGVELVAPSSSAEVTRFAGLGAPNVRAIGDLRNCAGPLNGDADQLSRLRAAIGDRPSWVAASTRDDEFRLAARIHRVLASAHPRLLTIIVPRRQGAGEAIRKRLLADGFTVAMRSAGEEPVASSEIYLADTLGELGLWYRLSPIAFVGGTFARKGGHNVLEPARLGAAVTCGPDVRNIAEVAADMVAAGALRRVQSEAELCAVIGGWLESAELLARDREAARRFAEHSATSAERMFEALRPLLAGVLRGAPRRG